MSFTVVARFHANSSTCSDVVQRRLGIEQLEKRLLMAVSAHDGLQEGEDVHQAEYALVVEERMPSAGPQLQPGRAIPLITTFSNPDNYETLDPNDFQSAPGDFYDGVVRLEIVEPDGSDNLCTGSLLPTRFHILTAAHCMLDNSLSVVQSITAVFVFADGLPEVPVSVNLNGSTFHPVYDGVSVHGNDLAILQLNSRAPANAPAYDVYRDSDEIGQRFNTVGYGRSGNGNDGQVLPDGIKRDGSNRYETLAEALNGTSANPFGPFFSAGVLLTFDFDNGLFANDAAGAYLGIVDTGLGLNEVMKAPGDSGGPSFIDGKIAGVSSFIWHLNGLEPDVSTEIASFGEFFMDTRVSTYADWVDSVIAPQVTSVVIHGTDTDHDPYSVPGGSGDQIETMPVGAMDTIQVTFSEHVQMDTQDFSLVSAIKKDPADPNEPLTYTGAFSYDPLTFTAELILDNKILEPDQVILTIADAVTDSDGNALDSDWTNPTNVTDTGTSTFPSGDGSPGSPLGKFRFYMTVMPGNGTRDNFIDQNDLDLVLGNWGMTPAVWTDGDTSGNGLVEQADLDAVLGNWGKLYRSWPTGGEGSGLMAMSGRTAAGTDLLDALYALDDSLATLGMHTNKTERLLSDEAIQLAATDQDAWDALLSDSASELNKQLNRQ